MSHTCPYTRKHVADSWHTAEKGLRTLVSDVPLSSCKNSEVPYPPQDCFGFYKKGRLFCASFGHLGKITKEIKGSGFHLVDTRSLNSHSSPCFPTSSHSGLSDQVRQLLCSAVIHSHKVDKEILILIILRGLQSKLLTFRNNSNCR